MKPFSRPAKRASADRTMPMMDMITGMRTRSRATKAPFLVPDLDMCAELSANMLYKSTVKI